MLALCCLLLGWGTLHAQDLLPFVAQWGRFTGAADHSSLNRQLSAADQITVQGPHFMRVGPDLRPGTADDTRVRLFGINLSHEAAFPSADRAPEVAATLRSMGFNAVRLHHMDTLPTADPQVFRSTLTTGPYPNLHTGATDRLRHFIAALRKEGLYVNLNLMVGYTFRPAIDGVPALDATGKPPGYASPVHTFHPKLVDLQVTHARRLIASLRLKTEPSLAQVEIMNESSLAAAWLHWDRNLWSDQIAGPYASELTAQWQAWVVQRHGSWDKACQAWQTCGAEDKSMPTPAQAEALQHGLSSGQLIKLKALASTWWGKARAALGAQPAHSTATAAHPKVIDALQFVAEVDRRFVNRLKAVVREETHAHMPVTGTQINFGAPLSFASHAQMDYVDAHYYLDHPEFPGSNWSDTDWRIRNESMAHTGLDSLLALAFLRDFSRPFVVSEFNQPHPNTQSYEVLPLVAAVAAQQDWDGLYFFDYTDGHTDRHTPHNFNLQGDWTKTSVIGLSARLFRTPSLPRLRAARTTAPSSDIWWSSAATDRRPDNWQRQLALRQGVAPAAALSQRVGYNTPTAQRAEAPGKGGEAVFRPHDEKAVHVTAPLVSGVFGEAQPSQALKTNRLTVDDPSQRPGRSLGVLIHSLDDLPLGDSKHMLMAVPGVVSGSVPGSTPPRPQRLIPYKSDRTWWTLEPRPGPPPTQTSSSRTAVPPLWVSREPLRIRLDHPNPRLTVFPLDPNGKRLSALGPSRVTRTEQQWVLDINQGGNATALWFELVLP